MNLNRSVLKICWSDCRSFGTTNVSWVYTGLASEIMRSGIFTITAYARDKFGHVGHTVVSGKNRGKYNLGEEEFASVSMAVKKVSNWNTTYADTIYSFTSAPGENKISVSAEISPARLAATLDNFVMWNVSGVNAYSGKPDAPHGGNPSSFLVQIPPVIAVPLGRPIPMGYTVFPRIEYDYEGETFAYYSPGHGIISQDFKDKCRQEYIDLGTADSSFPAYSLFKLPPSPYDTGHCGAYLMLPATINQLVTLRSEIGTSFDVLMGSAYRNPIYNKSIGGVKESPHIYGRGIDVNPAGRPDCATATEETKTEYARRMRALYNAAPSPKLLEYGAKIRYPASDTEDYNKDDVPDVFDYCRDTYTEPRTLGADHVHIGSHSCPVKIGNITAGLDISSGQA